MSPAGRLHDRFHERRADLFVALLDPQPGAICVRDRAGREGVLRANAASIFPD
jgi:hypothetical protein